MKEFLIIATVIILAIIVLRYSFFTSKKGNSAQKIIHLIKPDEEERLTYRDLPKEVYDAFLSINAYTPDWYVNLDTPHIQLMIVPKTEKGWGTNNYKELKDDKHHFHIVGVGEMVIFKKEIYIINPFVHPYTIPLDAKYMTTLSFQKISIKDYYLY